MQHINFSPSITLIRLAETLSPNYLGGFIINLARVTQAGPRPATGWSRPRGAAQQRRSRPEGVPQRGFASCERRPAQAGRQGLGGEAPGAKRSAATPRGNFAKQKLAPARRQGQRVQR